MKTYQGIVSGRSETSHCQWSKVGEEAHLQHGAECGPASAELLLTLFQSWDLLSCAWHGAEQAAGSWLAQPPPWEAPRHETSCGDKVPHLRLAPLAWACSVMPQSILLGYQFNTIFRAIDIPDGKDLLALLTILPA